MTALAIQRLAAFTRDGAGGNPAGVVICERLPDAGAMQALAAEVGYSETVFAAPEGGGFRVRFFAPRAEVPFCGHATIALGAALAQRHGPGSFTLHLNDGVVRVDGGADGASLHSPATAHAPAPASLLEAALALFALSDDELAPDPPPALIEAGARHLLLPLATRARLAAMCYDLAAGAELMRAWGLVTISLVQFETPTRIHARNAFAAGGVYEDPATGAAAAALAGYLRATGRAERAELAIVQGEDMGVPCLLRVVPPATIGGGAIVSGTVRRIG